MQELKKEEAAAVPPERFFQTPAARQVRAVRRGGQAGDGGGWIGALKGAEEGDRQAPPEAGLVAPPLPPLPHSPSTLTPPPSADRIRIKTDSPYAHRFPPHITGLSLFSRQSKEHAKHLEKIQKKPNLIAEMRGEHPHPHPLP